MSSPTPDEGDHPRRLFLALWPGEGERRALAALAGTVPDGRKVRPENLHLTLVFLGATSSECLACYEEVLRDIEVPALTLVLDCLVYRRRQQMLWLSASETPQPLVDLVTEINRRLQACDFTPQRRPFRAHLTLARKFRGPPPAEDLSEPLRWEVDQMVLVESLNTNDGVHYRVLRRWPAGDD